MRSSRVACTPCVAGFRASHPLAWDWVAARVPSCLTEAEEAVAGEMAQQALKEKKRQAERARRERRRLEEGARSAAAAALADAATTEDDEALAAALEEAKRVGCEASAVGAAERRLEELQDPTYRQRRERERRAAAAALRLGGLTALQAQVLLSSSGGLVGGDVSSGGGLAGSRGTAGCSGTAVDETVGGSMYPFSATAGERSRAVVVAASDESGSTTAAELRVNLCYQ